MSSVRVLLLALVWMVQGVVVQADDAVRVGIFGMVEQISPLVVAGREVSVPAALPVISPLGRGQKLAVGDTVAITVQVLGGVLTASRLLEVYPVIGPVARVTQDGAVIMGSDVHVPPDTSFRTGRWMALSGFWSGQKIITTNTRRVDGAGFAQLTGIVQPETLAIGASVLRDVAVPDAGFGTTVWMVSGTPLADGVQVRLLSKGLFAKSIALVLWQGYASAPVASQTYMIHGTGLIGTARDADMPAAGALVARCARDGRILTAIPAVPSPAFTALECARHIPVE